MEYTYERNVDNIEAVKQIIQSTFKDINVSNIRLIGKGNDSYAYEVNNNIIFKFPRHEKANRNIKKEIEILEFLENKLSYNVPKVLYVGNSNLNSKYTFAGFSKIEGVSLTKEIFDSLSEEQKEELVKYLSGFLKQLHSLNYNSYQEDIIENYMNDYNKIQELIYDKIDVKTKAKIDNLYKNILNNKDFLETTKSLVHNDFSCNNILFNKETKKVAGVIDFGDACVSDIDNDFYCLLEESDEELGRKFGIKVLEYYGYEDVNKVLRKSNFHEFYWMFEEIIYGYEYGYNDWIEEGLEKIKTKEFIY